MTRGSSSKHTALLVLATVLLSMPLFGSAVVTPEESAGLMAVKNAFSNLPAGWDRTNFDDVCTDTTPEYTPTGVTCVAGHVVSLYIAGPSTFNPTPGLSADFAGLSYMKTLYFLSTNIDVLPAEMATMTNLIDITWNSNEKPGLTAPAVLGQMPHLKNLRMVSNGIVSLPDMSGDTSLELFEASFSWMANFDSANLNALTSLKTFICVRCGNLTAVPDLSLSTNLQMIDVRYDEELTLIPDMFTNLAAFAQLTATGCRKLTHLPPSFGAVQMFSFNFGGCSLNQPDSIPDMSRSRILMVTLNDNGITTLPTGFCTFNKSIVNSLDLSQNMITTLPACFSQFSNMMSLDLSDNKISAFPAAALANMPQVYSLRLNKNRFGGLLPAAALAAMPQLSMLVLSDNRFQGSIPYSLFHKSGLSYVELSNNRLTGTIPDNFFVGCPLSSIMIEGNAFTGPFPSSIGQATNVGRISAARNKFTSIPDTIGQMGMFFQWIDFSNNRLTRIPGNAVWESLTSLMNIYLQNNPIGGPLPTWWAEAPISGGDYVGYIDLSNCRFTGTVPALNSQHLSGIWLSNNQLTGWGGVVYAPNLNYLYLDHNRIHTALPSNINLLSGLQEFDISHNRVGGTIPTTLSEVDDLTILRLNNNLLTGGVPNLSAMTLLDDFDISSNDLNICATNPSFNQDAPLTECDVRRNNNPCACTWYTAEGCSSETC